MKTTFVSTRTPILLEGQSEEQMRWLASSDSVKGVARVGAMRLAQCACGSTHVALPHATLHFAKEGLWRISISSCARDSPRFTGRRDRLLTGA